jgi:DNA replicative helicase MCM subunit Mcm2 (Cdc46/Mcm family)
MRVRAQMHGTTDMMLNVDCRDVHAFNSELYGRLVRYPTEVITIMDSVIKDIYGEISSTSGDAAEVLVR